MATYLIFLGPPGSGKGTQADFVKDKYGWFHLSTGELFREHIAKGTPLGVRVKDILASGSLVPDGITVAMVMERLQSPDTADGVIFDGFPRTLGQAESLKIALADEGKVIDGAIDFEIPDHEIIERLSARRSCPTCGAVYNMVSKPPRQDEVCDTDGTKLVQRSDDKPEVIQNRLSVYHRQTAPLIDYYRNEGLLQVVDAALEIQAVQADVDQLIKVLAGNASRAQVA
ncbi:MAG: adenylate kinase [Anaerolineae bacterium]